MIGNKAIFKQKYFLLYEILYINTFSVTEMNKNQKKKKKILDISISILDIDLKLQKIQNGCILMATFVLNIYIRRENRISVTTLLHFLEGNDVMMVHSAWYNRKSL